MIGDIDGETPRCFYNNAAKRANKNNKKAVESLNEHLDLSSVWGCHHPVFKDFSAVQCDSVGLTTNNN